MPTRVFPKEGVIFPSHLEIEDCGIKNCRYDEKRAHHHTPNPKGQAMKAVEMTIRRCLEIIKVFDEIPKGEDWTVARPIDYRKAFGDANFDPSAAVIPELWTRYQDGRLFHQVLDLAENLVMEDLSKSSRKVIKNGLNSIRQRLDS